MAFVSSFSGRAMAEANVVSSALLGPSASTRPPRPTQRRIPSESCRNPFPVNRSVFLAIAVVIGLTCAAIAQSPSNQKTASWTLTWSDEFNGPSGELPDASKWVIETGGRGWGNNELETYTARTQNVHQADGKLVITALKEDFTGPDGIARNYTSARLKTAGKFSQTYGRFEARIKIPRGQGIWPAFWMLGEDIATAGWPACGEIDIMENVGFEPSKVHGTLHGPGYSGENPLTDSYALPDGKRFADDFHIFAVEWEPEAIRFYVDDALYATQTPKDVPTGKRWVFNHPFFLLLNVAVGGNWPKYPDETTQFPQSMFVDYVRVYSRK
ncbi:MAG TPA: glycoside hydrolase family 16 protein [Terriglobales bacterium]|nr:glycoside hydrolase family 16 protein [Terriglobales bacterium]